MVRVAQIYSDVRILMNFGFPQYREQSHSWSRTSGCHWLPGCFKWSLSRRDSHGLGRCLNWEGEEQRTENGRWHRIDRMTVGPV